MPSKKDITFDLSGPPTAQNRIHAVFAGASGTFKTYAASSFPKPYFFDFDRGLKTIRNVSWDFDYDEYDENIGKLDSKMQEFERKCDYQTLIFDSTTLLGHDVLLYYCRLNGHVDEQGRPTKQVGQLEYGQRVKWLQNFIADLARIPLNIILICHETTYITAYDKEGNVTGPLVTRPSVPGKHLPDQLPVYFDESYHFDTVRVGGEVEAQVHTTSSGLFRAKTRLGLPPTIRFKWGENFYEKLAVSLNVRKEVKK